MNKKEDKRTEYCQFRNCKNISEVLVQINGKLYALCDKHYKLLDKVMDRVKSADGSVSLDDITVYEKNGRITKFVPKK